MLAPHPPLPRSPFPSIGEGLSAVEIEAKLRMSGATLSNCGERSVAALPGGAEPFAGRVGWRGYPSAQITGADTGFRWTYGFHPRPRVSAGLRFAVRSLSKALDRENNKVRRLCWHLIHRCRGPPSPHRGRLKRPIREASSPLSTAPIDY